MRTEREVERDRREDHEVGGERALAHQPNGERQDAHTHRERREGEVSSSVHLRAPAMVTPGTPRMRLGLKSLGPRVKAPAHYLGGGRGRGEDGEWQQLGPSALIFDDEEVPPSPEGASSNGDAEYDCRR